MAAHLSSSCRRSRSAHWPPRFLRGTRVVRLAIVDVGGEDRSCGRLPSFAGPDDLLAPIGVAHDDLRQQRDALAVGVATSLPGEPAAIPSISERDADRIRPSAKQVGDVVGLVLEPLVVARPTWREHLVADAAAVDLHLVQAEARHVCARGRDGAVERELGAKQGLGFERVVSSARSGVIHFAFHCAAPINPVSQNAGALHSVARPRSSHARTCQW